MTPQDQMMQSRDPRTQDRDIFDELQMDRTLVMCPPTYLDNKIPNNTFMKKGQKVDRPRAMIQFKRIVNMIRALDAEVLFIPPVPEAQDQLYCANLGISIEPYIILSKFKAPGRAVEIPPGQKFFEGMGYTTIQPPFYFEGEADLKKRDEHIYFGGWGQFSEPKAFRWIEEKTGVQIELVHEINEKAFHLDCALFVIDSEHFLVTTGGLDKPSIQTLEKYGEVIMAPERFGMAGVTNGINFPEKRIYLNGAFQPEVPDYRATMEWLNKIFDRFGYTVVQLDVDAYEVSGADLSCCTMELTFDPPGREFNEH